MRVSGLRSSSLMMSLALACGLLVGCGGGSDGGGGDAILQNTDPVGNDVHVVVAIGDSITYGNTPSYPEILSSRIHKTVINAGINGTLASENIARAQALIDQYHPGFMLILYGINDIIHGNSVDATVDALDQMLTICKKNHVTPALATYLEPIGGYAIFAPQVLLLNQGIRDLAAARGILYADLEYEFAADPALYEDDGLHPNDDGTALIALTFTDLF